MPFLAQVGLWLRKVPLYIWLLLAMAAFSYYQYRRAEGLEQDLATSEKSLSVCTGNQAKLESSIGEQNAKVLYLQQEGDKRAKQAKEAVAAAEVEAKKNQTLAAQILAERNKDNKPACEYASDAFDKQLAKERGL